tara:strand:+ start:734 stop:1105 length:372 start_codon:yes stop_codon:yes gene_type:complete
MADAKLIQKTPYQNGLDMVRNGYISEETLKIMIRNGEVAGPREKESFRLRGTTGKLKNGKEAFITVQFPTPSVTISGGGKLSDLVDEDREIVESWKDYLRTLINPYYKEARKKFTDKVMVSQS